MIDNVSMKLFKPGNEQVFKWNFRKNEKISNPPEKFRDSRVCFYFEIKGLGRLYVLSPNTIKQQEIV